LPLWGEDVTSEEINFEWPTEANFEKMSPDVKLQSLEFMNYMNNLGSVKVNLSNEQSSPVFKSQYLFSNFGGTIVFDPNDTIRAVNALVPHTATRQ